MATAQAAAISPQRAAFPALAGEEVVYCYRILRSARRMDRLDWQYTPYTWHFLLTIALSASLAWMAWQQRKVPGARSLAWLMAANTIWTGGYLLELSSAQLGAQIFWAKAQYLGICSAAPLFFVFTLKYTRQDAWLTRRNLALLFAIPLGGLALAWSNELHGLVWRQVGQARMGGTVILQVEHGPAFWMIVAYSYLMLVCGAFILVRMYLASQPLYRRQLGMMLVAAAAPWIGNILYVSGAPILRGLDLTPFAFAISGLAASLGLYRYGILRIVPVARERVIEMMSEALIVVDTEGRILDLNPAARALLRPSMPQGIAASTTRLLGRPLFALLAHWPELAGHYAANQEARIDIPLNRPEGRRDFELHITPLHDERGEHNANLLVLRDISERKAAEQALREAMRAAEQADRAKSSFLATMSHELRTPLNSILGFAQVMSIGLDGPINEMMASDLQLIDKNGRRLLNLINDIIDMAKIDAGRLSLSPQTIDLYALIEDMLIDTVPQAEGKGLYLHLEADRTERWDVYADPVRVRQVLAHLLDNAIKFTEVGGVTIEMDRFSSPGFSQEDRLQIHIRDSGIGIPYHQLDEIFEAFTQADDSTTRRAEGAGLGLAVSQRLCHLMGGEIRVQSTPGEGSTFTIRLPLHTPPAAEAASG